MTSYTIHSRHTAHTFGTYEGATPAEALAALIADAGGTGDADPTLDDVVIEEADPQWECQIEGDERFIIRAATAVEAAHLYVRGGDWTEEQDGWPGHGTLTVMVWTDGSDAPEFVKVDVQ